MLFFPNSHLKVVQEQERERARVRVVHRLDQGVARGLLPQPQQVLARHAPAEGESSGQRADTGEDGRLCLLGVVFGLGKWVCKK